MPTEKEIWTNYVKNKIASACTGLRTRNKRVGKNAAEAAYRRLRALSSLGSV